MTDQPTHLVAQAGDRRTLCGLVTRKALPLLLAAWLPMRPTVYVCPECERLA